MINRPQFIKKNREFLYPHIFAVIHSRKYKNWHINHKIIVEKYKQWAGNKCLVAFYFSLSLFERYNLQV